MLVEIKKIKQEISDRRDRLRDIVDDIESICQSLDEADCSLDNAVFNLIDSTDYISEYL